MELTRQEIINYGLRKGKSRDSINATLNANGYEDWKPVGDLGSNVVENAQRFARDFRSLTGALVQPVMTKGVERAFKDAIQSKDFQRAGAGALIGAPLGVPGVIAGAMLAGVGPKNLADAYLETYNTSTDKILSGQLRPRDILAGAYTNPLYAGLDIAPGIGLAKKGISSGISKAVPKDAHPALQAIIPSQELRDFNRSITNAMSSATAKSSQLYEAYNTLDSMPLADRLEITKNIVTNTGKLTKEEQALANAIKKDLKANEQEAIRRGFLNPVDAKHEAVGQYVMATFGQRVPELLHMDVIDYMKGNKARPAMFNALVDEPGFQKGLMEAIEEGNKLYDEDKISFLTQALSPTRDPAGNIVASDIAKQGEGYFGTKRIIGRTTVDDLSKVLDKSIRHQLSQITRATNASDVVGELIGGTKGVGELIETDLKTIPANKIVINKEMFDKTIANQITSGSNVDLVKALRDSQIGNKGGYLVDKIYGQAIENALKPTGSSGARRFMGAFKKAVLANPHWIVLNRIGNFTNNSIAGVRLDDYVDALSEAGRNILPERLKQQTAFNSYVGTGIEGLANNQLRNAIKQPINQLIRATERFKGSDKGLRDYQKLLRDYYIGSSDIVANPSFRLESSLERVDRYANFIRQAKREANATGKDWQDIVKEAGKNDELYNKLNNQVNLDLGDYLGRNYAIPAEWYNSFNLGVPFYRFLTQTGRTTAHQLANHPFGFHSMVMAPSRLGSNVSEAVLDRYPVGLNYEGGVPYKQQDEFGNTRTIGIEPLPAHTVASDIANLLAGKEMSRVASPLLTMGSDILNYKKGGKYMPSSPGYTQAKLTGKERYYEPSPSEVYSYALNQLLGTTYSPYRVGTIYGPELFSALTGRGLQSRYDVNPLIEDPLSYRREGPAELVGKWFGLQTRSNYPARSKRVSKSDRFKAMKNRQKLEKMKGNK